MEQKYEELTIKEILMQLIKNDTDNCEIKFKSGNLEFILDICITKILKNGFVEYDADEEKIDE